MRGTRKTAATLAGLLALGTTAAMAGPCTRQIDNLARRLSASDAGAGPTRGHPAPTAGSNQKGELPATAWMSKETKGEAISPRDVLRQGGIKVGASRALERARKLDAQGKRAACTAAVNKARRLSGM
jgi:hypothetical protein